MFIMSFNSAQLFILEPCMQTSSSPADVTISDPHRLDMLYCCLMSCQALLNSCLSHATETYSAISVIQLSSMGHGLGSLFRLSLVEQNGWDLQEVRKTVNLFDYFDRLISDFEQAGVLIQQMQPEPCRQAFAMGCSKAMRRVKSLYMSRINASGPGQSTPMQQAGPSIVDVDTNGSPFDWIDDYYWQELIGDGNDFTFQ
jgi:hypothetical protein